MGKLFDECIEHAKKTIPEFDETNPEHIELMIKAFVLSAKEDKKSQFIYDSYLKDFVEDRERATIKSMIENKKFDRNKVVTSRMESLQLEMDIIEHKMKVLKEFMD